MPAVGGAAALGSRSRNAAAERQRGTSMAREPLTSVAPTQQSVAARGRRPLLAARAEPFRAGRRSALQAGATRYDFAATVTIPDKSATMVMLLDKRVPGEAIALFAPDGGVPDSASHPFRVARFTNKTGGLLERGPLAIFSDGAFLGQGMTDPLPDGATATVPFALERTLAIDSEARDAARKARACITSRRGADHRARARCC